MLQCSKPNIFHAFIVWIFPDFSRNGKEALIESEITTYVRNHLPNARKTFLFLFVLSSLSFIYRFYKYGNPFFNENNNLEDILLYYALIQLFALATGIWFHYFHFIFSGVNGNYIFFVICLVLFSNSPRLLSKVSDGSFGATWFLLDNFWLGFVMMLKMIIYDIY